jgi:hypothetical protein
MRQHITALALVLIASLPAVAHAQDAAGAEALFQKGHQLFEQKKYAEACPKFAESYRLDPVTGSLLALAACHEEEGKLASAWAEYVDVAARARREGKNDRADAAQQRAAMLEPKLARITVALGQGADSVSGLQVKRDGIVIGSGTFGTALPVDRGEHTIEAAAPGRQPFSKRVTIADGRSEVVAIPILAESGKAETPVTPAPAPAPPAAAEADTSSGGSPLRTAGLIAGGVGIVVIGVGAYFGISAISKNNDSNANGCDATSNVCTSATGKGLRNDAVSAGNVSTALVVVGGLLTAGGVVMFLVGGNSGKGDSAPAKPAVAAAPVVGPGSAGLALSGRF